MKNTAEKRSTWDRITEALVGQLADNEVPWRQTWSGQAPMNYISKRPYSGINLMLLFGGKSPYWLTWKQVESLNGEVLPEERKNWRLVVYYSSGTKSADGKKGEKDKKPKAGEIKLTSDKKRGDKKYFVMRWYIVYNLAQTTIPIPEKPIVPKLERGEDIINGYWNPPIIVECANDPCYVPSLDAINLPPIEDFETAEDYYAALFHELVHSTGHQSRLDRFQGGYFGGNAYSEEELVAEVGACFLRGLCGFNPPNTLVTENSVAYVQHWHQRLSNDPDILRRAIMAAQKAVRRIRGTSAGE